MVEVVTAGTACVTTLFIAEGGKSPGSTRGLKGSTWLASPLHASWWLWPRFVNWGLDHPEGELDSPTRQVGGGWHCIPCRWGTHTPSPSGGTAGLFRSAAYASTWLGAKVVDFSTLPTSNHANTLTTLATVWSEVTCCITS